MLQLHSYNIGQGYRERIKQSFFIFLKVLAVHTNLQLGAKESQDYLYFKVNLQIRNCGREISRNILYYNGLCTRSPESE